MKRAKHKLDMKRIRGFTLVEVMTVVGIISLLTTIGIPGFLNARDGVRKNTCWNNMRVLVDAVQQYSIDANIPSNTTVSLYNDVIMPFSDNKNINLYVPDYLTCPANNDTYNNAVNNNNLNITCPISDATQNHGSCEAH